MQRKRISDKSAQLHLLRYPLNYLIITYDCGLRFINIPKLQKKSTWEFFLITLMKSNLLKINSSLRLIKTNYCYKKDFNLEFYLEEKKSDKGEHLVLFSYTLKFSNFKFFCHIRSIKILINNELNNSNIFQIILLSKIKSHKNKFIIIIYLLKHCFEI